MAFAAKTVKIILSVGLLLGGVFCYTYFFSHSPLPQEEIKVVEVVDVQPTDIKESIRLIGTIESKHSTVFFAKSKGVWEPLVKEGEFVKKGTLIGQIESANVERNYALSKNAENIACAQYERAAVLRKEGYLTKQGFEEKKNAWILAQKESSSAQIEFQKACFYAPFDGMLGVFKVRSGGYVDEGDQLVYFYDPSELMIKFDIPASVVRFVKEGQTVEIEGKKYELSHVQKIVDDETHMCPAYVDIDWDDYTIGSAIGVDLILREKKEALVIPFEAIFIQDGKMSIYRVEDNEAVLSNVGIGIRQKDQVEILSGLAQGDFLILRGQERLYPGVPVKVHKESLKENLPN